MKQPAIIWQKRLYRKRAAPVNLMLLFLLRLHVIRELFRWIHSDVFIPYLLFFFGKVVLILLTILLNPLKIISSVVKAVMVFV